VRRFIAVGLLVQNGILTEASSPRQRRDCRETIAHRRSETHPGTTEGLDVAFADFDREIVVTRRVLDVRIPAAYFDAADEPDWVFT
jgi:hypothetical protein